MHESLLADESGKPCGFPEFHSRAGMGPASVLLRLQIDPDCLIAMRLFHCIPLLALLACSPTRTSQIKEGQPVRALLTPNQGVALEILTTSTVQAGTYHVSAIEGQEDRGVLRLVGLRDVELDLTSVEMIGGGPGTDQDRFVGVGLLVEDCHNVRILGGVWKGYRQAIVVRDSTSVTIESADFSGMWSQGLQSTATGDDVADWIDPVGEGAGEIPAAITVIDVEGLTVRSCKVRHAQNGLLLNGVHGALVRDNDFSFLSGWGIALIDSEDCTVAYNATEYNVRGYSHGAYAVGHNSAGILLAGASHGNRIAFNRASHCGSGILLWGRESEDGRPSGNRLFGNDCSAGIQAGIQSVRSVDTLVQNNRIEDALAYGIRSQADDGFVVLENEIDGTQGRGLAFHGTSRSVVFSNRILNNQVGLEVAAKAPQGPDSQTMETDASAHHFIVGNRFSDNGQDLVASNSQALSFAGNRFLGGKQRLHVQGIAAWEDPESNQAGESEPQGQDTVVGWLAGSNGIMPTGSIEQVSLQLWDGELPQDLVQAQALAAPEIEGHPKSAAIVRSEFDGGTETVVIGRFGPWDFPSGEAQSQMRQPGGIFSGARWQANWFSFDAETHDPRGDLQAWRSLAETPILRRTVDHFLEPRPSDEIKSQVPSIRFGLIAETEIELPEAGSYQLSIMSDDGLRVWFGDAVVFEDWSWHATERKQVLLDLEAGVHTVRLEYFQLDGAAELALELHAR
ncbi:MAG: right-handed parallel beta-helix repeat-containing protein [Planctomycetes bacterium]|nr:right-handed parallel beta-helix repeat-containing protein [Planctomycetota bacterium]